MDENGVLYVLHQVNEMIKEIVVNHFRSQIERAIVNKFLKKYKYSMRKLRLYWEIKFILIKLHASFLSMSEEINFLSIKTNHES